MPLPLQPPRRECTDIVLWGEYSCGPGADAETTVIIERLDDETKIWMEGSFGGEKAEPELVGTLPAHFDWRSTVKFLVDNAESVGLPDDDLGHGTISGIDGHPGDLILMAWRTRPGTRRIAQALASCTDEQLTELTPTDGTFSSPTFCEELGSILDSLEEGGRSPEFFGPMLAEAHGDDLTPLEKCWAWLDAEEAAQAEQAAAREAKLRPFEAKIAAVVAAWTTQNPARGLAGPMGVAIKREKLYAALREHVIEHGELPTDDALSRM